MSWWKKLVLILVVVAAAAGIGLIIHHHRHSGPAEVAEPSGMTAPLPAGTVYRWQEDGTWVYSDRRREDGPCEAYTSDGPVSTLPFPQGEPPEQKDKPKKRRKLHIPLPTTIPAEKIPQLVEDARNLDQVLEQSRENLDRAIEQ